jgi:hypothetical protein
MLTLKVDPSVGARQRSMAQQPSRELPSPTRRRDRRMQRFKSPGSARILLSTYAATYDNFNVQPPSHFSKNAPSVSRDGDECVARGSCPSDEIVRGLEFSRSFFQQRDYASTSPDWEPVMKTAGAIITDRRGCNCHAAIVARELGVPSVVGAEMATSKLHNGDCVTVSCADGEVGTVYAGLTPMPHDRYRYLNA